MLRPPPPPCSPFESGGAGAFSFLGKEGRPESAFAGTVKSPVSAGGSAFGAAAPAAAASAPFAFPPPPPVPAGGFGFGFGSPPNRLPLGRSRESFCK